VSDIKSHGAVHITPVSSTRRPRPQAFESGHVSGHRCLFRARGLGGYPSWLASSARRSGRVPSEIETRVRCSSCNRAGCATLRRPAKTAATWNLAAWMATFQVTSASPGTGDVCRHVSLSKWGAPNTPLRYSTMCVGPTWNVQQEFPGSRKRRTSGLGARQRITTEHSSADLAARPKTLGLLLLALLTIRYIEFGSPQKR
jgi:hypothetical protein